MRKFWELEGFKNVINRNQKFRYRPDPRLLFKLVSYWIRMSVLISIQSDPDNIFKSVSGRVRIKKDIIRLDSDTGSGKILTRNAPASNRLNLPDPAHQLKTLPTPS